MEVVMGTLLMAVEMLMHPFFPKVVYHLSPKADEHYPDEKFQQQGQTVGYGQTEGNDDYTYQQKGGGVPKSPGHAYPKRPQRIFVLPNNGRYRYHVVRVQSVS